MDAQLFIRTWENDIIWLHSCLKSVARFWQSAYEPVIVATPECFDGDRFQIRDLKAKVYSEPKWADQRRGSVYIGLTADKFSDAEAILFTDSDCVFTRKCSANDMTDGKICLYGDPYAELMITANPPDHNCYTWYRRVAIEVLGIDPDHEYMRRHPFLFYRSTLVDFRSYVEKKMEMPLADLMAQYHSGYFSEFNLLSAYALKYEPDRYVMVPIKDAPPPLVRQFHSWSQNPTTLDISRELRQILK